jgi:hypothetical protein
VNSQRQAAVAFGLISEVLFQLDRFVICANCDKIIPDLADVIRCDNCKKICHNNTNCHVFEKDPSFDVGSVSNSIMTV